MATQVAPLEHHSGDTTLSRAMSSYTKLLRAAYLQDTIEELEQTLRELRRVPRPLADLPAFEERAARLRNLIDFYRAERRAIAAELGL